ncbi:MAG: ABC transporter, ATP-binding protein, partial [uncultured Thermomicrobiales bacterium]
GGRRAGAGPAGGPGLDRPGSAAPARPGRLLGGAARRALGGDRPQRRRQEHAALAGGGHPPPQRRGGERARAPARADQPLGAAGRDRDGRRGVDGARLALGRGGGADRGDRNRPAAVGPLRRGRAGPRPRVARAARLRPPRRAGGGDLLPGRAAAGADRAGADARAGAAAARRAGHWPRPPGPGSPPRRAGRARRSPPGPRDRDRRPPPRRPLVGHDPRAAAARRCRGRHGPGDRDPRRWADLGVLRAAGAGHPTGRPLVRPCGGGVARGPAGTRRRSVGPGDGDDPGDRLPGHGRHVPGHGRHVPSIGRHAGRRYQAM